MTIERFVRQLDGSTFASGNCSAASDAMFLYRATQGRVATSGAHIRALTGDTSGGLNLDQVRQVNENAYSVYSGRVYRPIQFSMLHTLIDSGRYGAIIQGGYSVLRDTEYDCFRGKFGLGHAGYLSRGGTTVRWGDPGADGRYAGCPDGFQSLPWSVLGRFANALPLKPGVTLASEWGPGYAYAYLTPADPPAAAYLVKVSPDHFYSYPTKVVDGIRVISGNPTRHGTGGFSADCSKPGTVHWPGHTSRRLVQVTREASRYFGLWLNEYGQNVTVSAK